MPSPPRLLFRSAALGNEVPDQSRDGYVPSGVHWSPDAACIATAQDDCVLLYDTPASALGPASSRPVQQQLLRPSLVLPQGGETIYSFAFYPGFDVRGSLGDDATAASASAHPCCLATSSRGQPVRLWDCLTGASRASYAASSAAAPEGRGAVDSLATPLAVAFSPDGAALAAGYPRGDLVLFDVGRPGRDSEAAAVCCRPLRKRGRRRGGNGRDKQQRQQQQQAGAAAGTAATAYAPNIRLPGPIGCVAFAPSGTSAGGGPAHVLAAGSYGGAVGVFDVRVGARRRVVTGGGGGLNDASAVAAEARLAAADLALPVEFGRSRKPPRITADAAAVPAAAAALSLAPVLAIDCCGAGGGAGGGVTQLLFAPPGSARPLLFAGYRGAASFSGRIDAWDVRALREPAASTTTTTTTGPDLCLRRRGGDAADEQQKGGAPHRHTPARRRSAAGPGPSAVPGRHQRIQFDVDPGAGRFLVTGSGLPDGRARVWGGIDDPGAAGGAGGAIHGRQPGLTLLASLRVAHGATANAVAVCPGDPSLLAVASGQRGYPLAPTSEEDEEDGEDEDEEDAGGGGDLAEEGGEEQQDLPRAGLALWRWGGGPDVDEASGG